MIKNHQNNTNLIVQNLGNAIGDEIKLVTNFRLLENNTKKFTNENDAYIVHEYTCLMGKFKLYIYGWHTSVQITNPISTITLHSRLFTKSSMANIVRIRKHSKKIYKYFLLR